MAELVGMPIKPRELGQQVKQLRGLFPEIGRAGPDEMAGVLGSMGRMVIGVIERGVGQEFLGLRDGKKREDGFVQAVKMLEPVTSNALGRKDPEADETRNIRREFEAFGWKIGRVCQESQQGLGGQVVKAMIDRYIEKKESGVGVKVNSPFLLGFLNGAVEMVMVDINARGDKLEDVVRNEILVSCRSRTAFEQIGVDGMAELLRQGVESADYLQALWADLSSLWKQEEMSGKNRNQLVGFMVSSMVPLEGNASELALVLTSLKETELSGEVISSWFKKQAAERQMWFINQLSQRGDVDSWVGLIRLIPKLKEPIEGLDNAFQDNLNLDDKEVCLGIFKELVLAEMKAIREVVVKKKNWLPLLVACCKRLKQSLEDGDEIWDVVKQYLLPGEINIFKIQLGQLVDRMPEDDGVQYLMSVFKVVSEPLAPAA